jgi:Tfp pilus assembly protein PilO
MDDLFCKIVSLSASMRYALVGVVCSLIVFLLYYQDILPLYQELNAAQNQEQQLTQTLRRLYYQETVLEVKMPQLPATKAILNEWQKEFIKRADVDKLLKVMIKTARKNKLTVLLTEAAPIMLAGNYPRQPFKFVLRGDYVQLIDFIKQIANLPWLVIVNRFALNELSPSLFSADVEFSVYYLK